MSRKPLYPLGEAVEMARFHRKQSTTPAPEITEEILALVSDVSLARWAGGISSRAFTRAINRIASQHGFVGDDHLGHALCYDSRSVWPFSDRVPQEWGPHPSRISPEESKELAKRAGRVIR